MERLESTSAGIDAVDDDGGDRIARRGLERRLPAVVDLDDVEERPEHAVDVGEAFCARPGARLVEGHLEGVGAGDPAVPLGLGLGGRGAGRVERRLGGQASLLGVVEAGDERSLGRLGPRELVAQP